MHDLRDLDALRFHKLMDQRIQRGGIKRFHSGKLFAECLQQSRGFCGGPQSLAERLFIENQGVVGNKELFVIQDVAEHPQPVPHGGDDLSNQRCNRVVHGRSRQSRLLEERQAASYFFFQR